MYLDASDIIEGGRRDCQAVLVLGLPTDFNMKTLKECFCDFGIITWIHYPTPSETLITFGSHLDAEKAVRESIVVNAFLGFHVMATLDRLAHPVKDHPMGMYLEGNTALWDG